MATASSMRARAGVGAGVRPGAHRRRTRMARATDVREAPVSPTAPPRDRNYDETGLPAAALCQKRQTPQRGEQAAATAREDGASNEHSAFSDSAAGHDVHAERRGRAARRHLADPPASRPDA